jgi:hypothetical protein
VHPHLATAAQIFIGCAGGGDTAIDMSCALEAAPAGAVPMRLAVSGLLGGLLALLAALGAGCGQATPASTQRRCSGACQGSRGVCTGYCACRGRPGADRRPAHHTCPPVGGHSGLNINEDRGNAVVMLAQTIAALREAVPGARVASLAGGDKRNAIPREASAELLVGGCMAGVEEPGRRRALGARRLFRAALAGCHWSRPGLQGFGWQGSGWRCGPQAIQLPLPHTLCLQVPAGQEGKAQAAVSQRLQLLASEFGSLETDLSVSLSSSNGGAGSSCMAEADLERVRSRAGRVLHQWGRAGARVPPHGGSEAAC